jgi:hypothetical protein
MSMTIAEYAAIGNLHAITDELELDATKVDEGDEVNYSA